MSVISQFMDSDNDKQNRLTSHLLESTADDNALQIAAAVAAVDQQPPSKLLHDTVRGFYVPMYSLYSYRSHFRMSRSTFEVKLSTRTGQAWCMMHKYCESAVSAN